MTETIPVSAASGHDVFDSVDLLVHIMQYLKAPGDRDAASRVSKSWRHAFCGVPQLLTLREAEDARMPRWRNSNVVSLKILLGAEDLVKEGVQLATQQYWHSLQRLTLWGALPSVTTCDIKRLAQCTHLVSLSLHEVGVAIPTDIGAIAWSCQHLEEVHITYETYPGAPWILEGGCGYRGMFGPVWQVVTDGGIEELINSCKKLRVLELQNCRAIGDPSAAALWNAPNLETLSLVGMFNFSAPGLACIAGCLSLENLTLDLRRYKVEGVAPQPGIWAADAFPYQPFDATQTLFALADLPQLKQLRLGSFMHSRGLPTTWPSLESLRASLALLTRNLSHLKQFAKECQSLREVDILSESQGAPANNEGGEVLKRIGWACPPHLEKLSIQCNKVDPLSVDALTYCLRLSSLQISSTAVTSNSIAYLAARTQRLTELSLASSQPVRGVSDEGVEAIVQAAPSLRRLDLSRSTSLSDIGFASLARLPQLKSLNVSFTAIGDIGLVTLINSIPTLVELVLEGCENVTNFTPVTWLPLLEILGLQRCENAVTDNLVEEIVDRCKRLREAYFDGCRRLTDCAYVALAECRTLSMLSLKGCEDVETGLLILAASSIGWLTKVIISQDVPSCRGADLLRSRGILDVRL